MIEYDVAAPFLYFPNENGRNVNQSYIANVRPQVAFIHSSGFRSWPLKVLPPPTQLSTLLSTFRMWKSGMTLLFRKPAAIFIWKPNFAKAKLGEFTDVVESLGANYVREFSLPWLHLYIQCPAPIYGLIVYVDLYESKILLKYPKLTSRVQRLPHKNYKNPRGLP